MAEVRYSKYRIAVRRWSNVNVVLEAIGLAHINTLGLMGSVSRRTDLGFDSPHLCFFHQRRGNIMKLRPTPEQNKKYIVKLLVNRGWTFRSNGSYGKGMATKGEHVITK